MNMYVHISYMIIHVYKYLYMYVYTYLYIFMQIFYRDIKNKKFQAVFSD